MDRHRVVVSGRRVFCIAAVVFGASVMAASCTLPRASLTALGDARRLSAAMRLAFGAAAESSSRAVMAGTEIDSRQAAGEARQLRQAVQRDAAALVPLLQALRYDADGRLLQEFSTRYEAYQRLDDEVLVLAVESTNVKAQRLSFGDGAAAAAAFVEAVDAGVRAAPSQLSRHEAAAARAKLGVFQMQALQAPHIAEAGDTAMTAIEARMAAAAASSRRALAELLAGLPSSAGGPALAAFERYLAVHAEIVALSRQNTNVRSLALTLGRKRALAAGCDDALLRLDEALAGHASTATR